MVLPIPNGMGEENMWERYWKTFKCNESANSLKKNVLYKTDNLELSKPYLVNKLVFFPGPR